MALKDYFVAPPMPDSATLLQQATAMGHKAGNYWLDIQTMPPGTHPATVKQTLKQFTDAGRKAARLNNQANWGPVRRGVNRLGRSALRTAIVGVPRVGGAIGVIGGALATVPAAASAAYNASVDRLAKWIAMSGALGKKYTLTQEQINEFWPRATVPTVKSRNPTARDYNLLESRRSAHGLPSIITEDKVKDLTVVPKQTTRQVTKQNY